MLSNIVVVDISDVSAGFQMKKAWQLQTLMRFKVFTAIMIVFFYFGVLAPC
jgi:hypothetical protein